MAEASRPAAYTSSATLTRVGTGTVATFANGALQGGSATHVLLGGATYVCVVTVTFLTSEPITAYVRGRIIKPDGSVHSPARLLRCALEGRIGSVELAFLTVRMEEDQ